MAFYDKLDLPTLKRMKKFCNPIESRLQNELNTKHPQQNETIDSICQGESLAKRHRYNSHTHIRKEACSDKSRMISSQRCKLWSTFMYLQTQRGSN